MTASVSSSAVSGTHEVKGSSNGTSPDCLILAIYYLMQSASITCQNALIRSKQLQWNAASQEALNQMQGQENFAAVPSELISKDRETISVDYHHHVTPFGRVTWTSVTKKYKTLYNVKNQGILDSAQAANQQIAGIRQIITDKQNLLSQDAQVQATGISSESDLSSQIFQMVGSMLQNVQSLAFYACLRQPISP